MEAERRGVVPLGRGEKRSRLPLLPCPHGRLCFWLPLRSGGEELPQGEGESGAWAWTWLLPFGRLCVGISGKGRGTHQVFLAGGNRPNGATKPTGKLPTGKLLGRGPLGRRPSR